MYEILTLIWASRCYLWGPEDCHKVQFRKFEAEKSQNNRHECRGINAKVKPPRKAFIEEGSAVLEEENTKVVKDDILTRDD